MPPLHPSRLSADSPLLEGVLTLVQESFAYMEARIDPPSSMRQLNVAKIQQACETGEVWVIGTRPEACVFLTVKGASLYIGKLAVQLDQRGQGLAKELITLAETRARALGLAQLELETRIELTENHETFAKLGFSKTGEGRHPGYDQPTYIVMHKPVLLPG